MFNEQKVNDIESIDFFKIQDELKNSFISETDLSFTTASKFILIVTIS